MLTRLTLTLTAHAFEHAAVHFARQIDRLDPHIQHFDTQLAARTGIQRGRDIGHELVALTGNHLVQRTASHFVAQAGFQLSGQPILSQCTQAGGSSIETLHIRDAPFGIGIHHQGFLFQRQVALGCRVEGQQTAIKQARLLDEGQLEMQARLNVRAHHLAELQYQSALNLADHEKALPADCDDDKGQDQPENSLVAHQRVSLERASRDCVWDCRLAASPPREPVVPEVVAEPGLPPCCMSLSSGR